jgi:hypothetical protein
MIFRHQKRVNQQTAVSALLFADISLLLVLSRMLNAGFLTLFAKKIHSGMRKQ